MSWQKLCTCVTEEADNEEDPEILLGLMLPVFLLFWLRDIGKYKIASKSGIAPSVSLPVWPSEVGKWKKGHGSGHLGTPLTVKGKGRIFPC